MEERRRAIAQQQERIATARSGQSGLAVKKISLTEELSRLKAERPGLAFVLLAPALWPLCVVRFAPKADE